MEALLLSLSYTRTTLYIVYRGVRSLMEVSRCGAVDGTAGESAVFSSKPFFAAGTVETDVDKSLREAEEGDQQSAPAVSTDAVMREVQEEHNFLRLLHRMRGELQIADRVYDRVPHFQVHPSFLAGCVSVDNQCESNDLVWPPTVLP